MGRCGEALLSTVLAHCCHLPAFPGSCLFPQQNSLDKTIASQQNRMSCLKCWEVPANTLPNLSIFSSTKGKIETCDFFLHSVSDSFALGYLLASVYKRVKRGINYCLSRSSPGTAEPGCWLPELEQSSMKLRLHLGTSANLLRTSPSPQAIGSS